MTPDEPVATLDAAGELEDVLSSLALLLERPDIIRLPAPVRSSQLRGILAERRTLIVFDNFETVRDPRVLVFLSTLPETCSVLLTSRRPVSFGMCFPLEPLKEHYSRALVQRLASDRNVAIPPEQIEQLHVMGGGLPLALEWMIGRLAARAPHDPTVVSGVDLDRLLDYLFLDTARWLLQEGHTLTLLAVASLPSQVPARLVDESLEAIGQLRETTSGALAALLGLGLVRFDADTRRYEALPVVKHFLLSHAHDPRVVPVDTVSAVARSIATSLLQHLHRQADRLWNGRYTFAEWNAERLNVFDSIRASLAGRDKDLAVDLVAATYPFAITFGHFQEYTTWCRELLAYASDDSIRRLTIEVRLASMLLHTGHLDEAADIVVRIEHTTTTEQIGPQDLRNFVYFVRSVTRVAQHRADAEDLLREAIAFEEKRGVAWARLGFQGWLVLHLVAAGRLQEALRLAATSLEEARQLQDFRTETFLSVAMARVQNGLGQYEQLLQGATELIDRARTYGEEHNRAHLYRELAHAAMMAGTSAQALEWLSAAIDIYKQFGLDRDLTACTSLRSRLRNREIAV
jgi:LuxR family glucitol operon transcriptional activator